MAMFTKFLMMMKENAKTFVAKKPIAIWLALALWICAYVVVNTEITYAYDLNQNPSRLKWKQINAENFNVVYPVEFETEAQRVANTLNSLVKREAYSLRKKPNKITLVLQNQTLRSNGFVGLTPWQMQFMTTPTQGFVSTDWLQALCVHELRHVTQFTKLIGWGTNPFVQIYAELVGDLNTFPNWLAEGDAVCTETALTESGRGRMPSFDLAFRTNILSGRRYSYSKDYIGSFRDRTPGWYPMGYHMVAKLRRDHGPWILDSIFTRMAKFPLRPYALSNSIKKYTGMTSKQLHDSTVNELHKKWQTQLSQLQIKDYKIINKTKLGDPVDYLSPTPISSNELVALKTGNAYVNELVRIDSTGKETPLLKIGEGTDEFFPFNLKFAAGKIVWDEVYNDKRFQLRSFSKVNVYDLNKRKYKKLLTHSRLLMPALSPDGKTIAAIDISYSNKVDLVELNAETGQAIHRYPSPSNVFLSNPAYNQEGDKIVVSSTGIEGCSIYELNKKDSTFNRVLGPTRQFLLKPIYAEGQIVFSAYYNGINNIYRLDPNTKKVFQLTSARYGAFNPSYDSLTKRLFFNNYQVTGMQISSINYQPNQGDNVDTIKNTFINYAEPLVAQEGNRSAFDSITNYTYPSKPYREIEHVFNFHSAYPYLPDLNNYTFSMPSFRLQSNNLLNTLDLGLEYQYNQNIHRSNYIAEVIYSRFYPILDFSYQNTARLSYNYWDNTPIRWREHEIEAYVTFPFNYYRLNTVYSLNFSIGTDYIKRYQIVNKPLGMTNIISFPLSWQLDLSRSSAISKRDLAPKWGQSVSLMYQDLSFQKHVSGASYVLETAFYFPGIWRNHSLQASFNYQKFTGNYSYSNEIPTVAGYDYLNDNTALKNTFFVSYLFPFLYPDWEIGPLAYIKRLKAKLFSDYQNLHRNMRWAPASYGLEINADGNLLRYPNGNVSAGARVIFLNGQQCKTPVFETTFTYNIP